MEGSAWNATVIGTAHKGHLLIPDFPLSKLDMLLAAYHPDLVLVEIRPEAFAEGHYEDGPLEMSYLVLRARARGIAVEPIDWYLDSNVGVTPSDDEASAAAYAHEFGALEQRTDHFDSFSVINSPERTRDFLTLYNAQMRLGLASGAAWERRQSWFNYRALDAVHRHHAGRVAAFVGFAHRPQLASFLRDNGAVLTDPRELDAPARPENEAPMEVVAFWREAVARLRDRLRNATEPARRNLLAKIRYWEVAIERRGACCVDATALRATP